MSNDGVGVASPVGLGVGMGRVQCDVTDDSVGFNMTSTRNYMRLGSAGGYT